MRAASNTAHSRLSACSLLTSPLFPLVVLNRCALSYRSWVYKEAQIHGPLLLSRDVSCLFVHPRHCESKSLRQAIDRFGSRCNVDIIPIELSDEHDGQRSSDDEDECTCSECCPSSEDESESDDRDDGVCHCCGRPLSDSEVHSGDEEY